MQPPDFYPNNINLLEEAVESWSSCITQATNKIFGKKKVFKGAKPWWSNQLDKLRRETQKLRRQFRKKRTQEHMNYGKCLTRDGGKTLNLRNMIHLPNS